MRLLAAHPWPGNVRELKSALEYAFVVTDAGPVEPRHLPPSLIIKAAPDALREVCRAATPVAAGRDELVDALRRAGGNRSEAARLLGVSRGTILNRMRRYGVDSKHVLDF